MRLAWMMRIWRSPARRTMVSYEHVTLVEQWLTQLGLEHRRPRVRGHAAPSRNRFACN